MSLPERLKQQFIDNNTKNKIDIKMDNEDNKNNIKIIIVGSEYLTILSNNLKFFIENILEINCVLISYEDFSLIETQKENEYFFIIGFTSQNLTINYNFKYFLYQLEQLNTKKKQERVLTEENQKLILNSVATFDYSKLNIENYPSHLKNKIELLRPPLNNKKTNNIKKKYDVLFYGSKTVRRSEIIENLNNFFTVKYVENVYGEKLENLISESKICLNLYYYENNVLETVRLHELLNHNSIIISEYPCEQDLKNSKNYYNVVNFIEPIKSDLSNINNLITLIDELLTDYDNSINSENYRLKNINNIFKTIYNDYLIFNFYLHKVLKHKNLFHKYLVGSINKDENIQYSIFRTNVKSDFIQNNLYAHLHCYDINNFYNIYSDYLEVIEHFFKIIITYSVGNVNNNLKNSNYLILKIKNKGLDIGAKFCCIKYLNDNNVDYDYVFFMHSKTNETIRKQYFQPFFKYLKNKKIKSDNIQELYKYDGIFPDVKWKITDNIIKNDKGDVLPERNNLYRNELLDYLNCENKKNKIFFEGNVYILSKSVIDVFFTDRHIYNMLNNGKVDDFDYNWMLFNTPIEGKNKFSIQKAYEFYNTEEYQNKVKDIFKSDSCIENCFERAILNFCNSYRSISYYNTCCVIFYVDNVKILNKILIKYNKLFKNTIYSKLTKILLVTDSSIKKKQIQDTFKLNYIDILVNTKVKDTIGSFTIAIDYLKKNKYSFNVYLTVSTIKFENMGFYYSKLDLLYKSLDDIYLSPLHTDMLI